MIKPARKTSTAASVRKSQLALVQRGGRRMPSGYLQPDAASALETLIAVDYGKSPVKVIAAALLEVEKRLRT